jgi:predicted transposase/invertase (TIGR01784 family)
MVAFSDFMLYNNTMSKLLSPLTDIIFKRIFGDARNADILANLLLTILSLPKDEYTGLEFVDTYLKPDAGDGKVSILDVKVTTKSGKILDIEIQLFRVTAMRARILYYASKLIVDQMGESDGYSKIKPVILIVLTDFNLMPKEAKYHNVYRLMNEESHKDFTGLLEVHTIEMPKFPQQGDGTPLDGWMRFMKIQEEGDIAMAVQANPMIEKAYGVLAKLSADEVVREQALAREMAVHDYYSLLEDREQAFAEREQAFAERKQAFAERDKAFAERDKVFAERDKAFAELEAERKKAFAELEAEREKTRAVLRSMGMNEEQIARAMQD